MAKSKSTLALLGGQRAVSPDKNAAFQWPIVTPEMEAAVLEVLRAGKMSGLKITMEFEKEYARWMGLKYALAHNNGTAALHGTMYGLKIGHGDEIICPAMTYWASCLPVLSLGGTVVFADIEADTLCIDPRDIERRISERTRAIVVVHYSGRPADMDPILEIARRRKIRVIEDCSHSHGSLYKGRLTGTMGDAGVFSLMSAKSFPVGEGGILVTDDREIFERAVAFGHYARHADSLTLPGIKEGGGIPWGGVKYRLNQLCSAIGRIQLKLYPKEMAEIDRAMNRFWDLLEGLPGIRSQRPPEKSGCTMGGWYNPLGLYRSEELGGLSVARFCEAVRAEGFEGCRPGCNRALHTHPLLNDLDVYNQGRPTRIANLAEGVDVRQAEGSLPVSEGIQERVFSIPWFKKDLPELIGEYAGAFHKVVENHRELIPGDAGNPQGSGLWGTSAGLRR